MIKYNLNQTFNSICVDGDTSTNDTFILFSTFEKKQKKIKNINSIKKISLAVKEVMFDLSLQLEDGYPN